MRLRGVLLLLLLALCALWRTHGDELRALAAGCRQSGAQAAADAQTIAALRQRVAGQQHRVLDFARCYRSCLFMCVRPGVRGSNDALGHCVTSCTTQCEALADVKEVDLASLG